jgi:hypothetical protein
MHPNTTTAGAPAAASVVDSVIEPGSIADHPDLNDPFRPDPDSEI